MPQYPAWLGQCRQTTLSTHRIPSLLTPYFIATYMQIVCVDKCFSLINANNPDILKTVVLGVTRQVESSVNSF